MYNNIIATGARKCFFFKPRETIFIKIYIRFSLTLFIGIITLIKEGFQQCKKMTKFASVPAGINATTDQTSMWHKMEVKTVGHRLYWNPSGWLIWTGQCVFKRGCRTFMRWLGRVLTVRCVRCSPPP